MNPILLQKQLRENASDLDEFYKELKSWGEDMKKKEESIKKPTNSSSISNNNVSVSDNKKRKITSNEKKTRKNAELKEKPKSKIGVTDYSAWEKFDVDAECEKVDFDENGDSELTDESDEALRDQAYVEKEKGNKFVKNQKWKEAIECYTKAIDCYSYDPVFYANRALCYLKIENMTKAESDCTMSLKLDKSYVKAYLRRAAAREALNKLEEAEIDLLKVLELEPKNKESKNSLDNLRKKLNKEQTISESVQRPVSKFTASRNQRRIISNQTSYPQSSDSRRNNIQESNSQPARLVDPEKCTSHWPSGDDNIIPVKAVNKPVYLRSKKPLKRIDISETVGFKEENTAKNQGKIDPLPKPNEMKVTLKTDDLKIIERKENLDQEMLKEVKNYTNNNKLNEAEVEICAPKNSVQFYSKWRHLKTLDNKYALLKLIKPEELPNIFKESLDSGIFSEILEVLAKCFIKNNEKMFNFLSFFTKMKRFSTFTMFMSDNDKNYLWKLFDYIRENEDQSEEEINTLIKKYEL